MSRNSRTITLGQQNYLVVDLTLPLTVDQEGYPGDFKPTRSVISDIERDGWQHYTHELGDHCFHPHCDAPKHFLGNRQHDGMEKYDLSWSFHKACLIDLSGSPEAGGNEGIRFLTEVRKGDLKPLASILSTRSALIIRTGYDRWVEKNLPHLPEWLPYLTSEAAEFLGSYKNLRVVGIDSLTVDPVGLQTSHLALREKMIVEALVHLDEIPAGNHLEFDLQTTPTRIVGATGGPLVVYAYIPV
ncbi:MAG: cyclase family protein [Bacteroidales bacterium]|nr:cyclase family protein [Bacteroidales bacterium]